MRNVLAGGLALLNGLLLTWILSEISFPTNYTLIFIIAFLYQFVSIVLQTGIIERYPSNVMPKQSIIDYFSELKKILRENIPFRNFIMVCTVLIVAGMPIGFFTVFALKQFRADEYVVGEFTILMIAGQITGALLNGYVADRYGNKCALISTAVTSLFACLWALSAPTLFLFKIIFYFVGISLGSETMIRYNLAIEYGPVEERSTYIGLMNTILAPFYFSGLLGGWLSDKFGYETVFFIGVVFYCISILLLVWLVREPRYISESNK